MTPRRSDFAAFVLDLLDFIEEKVDEALENDTSRRGAVAEAAGAVPVLRGRLRENEPVQAQFMVVFDEQLYEPQASRWWAEFAGMDGPAFETRAADLKRWVATLRKVAAAGAGPS
ncbi:MULTISPECIES: hypothetical protein [Bradyrhizobium]|uniref:hypothetical protein n=1 Tax=Bradyrhizobium TaxID=374 RepID=UPI000D738234|nr:hypothetical protein [Bradyrhizobium diazoefficiens]AWO92704.1 hypothetical protein DI395_32180 [Bradyrhizobium diazoefficiens]